MTLSYLLPLAMQYTCIVTHMNLAFLHTPPLPIRPSYFLSCAVSPFFEYHQAELLGKLGVFAINLLVGNNMELIYLLYLFLMPLYETKV